MALKDCMQEENQLALQDHVSTVVLQINMSPSSVKFKDLDEL